MPSRAFNCGSIESQLGQALNMLRLIDRVYLAYLHRQLEVLAEGETVVCTVSGIGRGLVRYRFERSNMILVSSLATLTGSSAQSVGVA